MTVVLDERGKALSSIDLARKLEAWRDGGKREARFLIGAADGHDEEQRKAADLLLSLGRRPGLICWSGRCWPSNCSGRHRSLRTTLIIAKVSAMARLALLLLLARCCGGERARAATAAEPLDAALQRARAEQARRAGDRAARADRATGRSRSWPAPAERAAAAQAIEAAEARITAADAQLRIVVAYAPPTGSSLREQQPIASLLAGLAIMAGARRCSPSPIAAAPTNWSKSACCSTRPCR